LFEDVAAVVGHGGGAAVSVPIVPLLGAAAVAQDDLVEAEAQIIGPSGRGLVLDGDFAAVIVIAERRKRLAARVRIDLLHPASERIVTEEGLAAGIIDLGQALERVIDVGVARERMQPAVGIPSGSGLPAHRVCGKRGVGKGDRHVFTFRSRAIFTLPNKVGKNF